MIWVKLTCGEFWVKLIPMKLSHDTYPNEGMSEIDMVIKELKEEEREIKTNLNSKTSEN